jgi:Flp pilus assembly protein TadD
MPARHPTSNRTRPLPFSGRAVSILVLAAALTGLGGCASRGAKDTTGSIGQTDTARSAQDWQAIAADWKPRYDKDPGNKQASMSYARALRGLHQEAQAVAVMQNAAIRAPNDRDVLALYGRTLADAGRFPEAAKVLANAHTPDQPDWRIYNVQGTVAAQTGDFAGAQRFFDLALQMAPGDPSVLSNMGLAYALQRRLADAERVLRQAANNARADTRVRANLALVLALQGKFSESEQIAQRDLPPADAAANVAYVRNMMSQTNSWKQLQALDKATPKRRG